MQVVCGHCGKAVDADIDVGQGLQCPRCASRVSIPEIGGQLNAPPDPDETAVVEAIDISFADKAREALRKSAKIHLSCGSCGKHLTVGARLAGRRAKCPNCKDHIRIPYPDDQDDFEIEALAMATDVESEELDLGNVDGANVAAAALRQAEQRTAGTTGKSSRKAAADRRLQVRALEAKRSRRR
ncbi:MAG: hypothetical protein ACLFV7_09330, partial [Phycisphaerae bacterium]